MPRVTLKDAKGDEKAVFALPDPTSLSELYGYVIDNVPLPAGLDPQILVLGLWDPHHKTYYPLAPHSDKPLIQFCNKGAGNEEISVYLLTVSDVIHTTTGA